MPADDEGQEPENFQKGASKSGLKKLNKLVSTVKRHEEALKKFKGYSPYIISICVDNEGVLMEIMARKFDGGEGNGGEAEE